VEHNAIECIQSSQAYVAGVFFLELVVGKQAHVVLLQPANNHIQRPQISSQLQAEAKSERQLT
jgi:hypothetical protein